MDQDCSAGLSLGLGIGNGTSTREKDQKYDSQINMNGPLVQLDLFPVAPVLPPDSGCGTLPWEKASPLMGTSGGGGGNERSAGEAKAAIHQVPVSWRSDANKLLASCFCNEDAGAINVSSSNSTVDSNGINPVSGYAGFKRNRGATEELENDLVCSRILNDAEEEDCSKKKLRLSREQCALLEESFSKNRAPEPRQKEALALKLNLRPRQVEVWFQNRRARTKLKQTEVDCELLKRYNDALAEENRKLHKELEELRVRKLSSPLGPAPTLTMCPSCERVSAPRNSSHFTLEKARSMIMRGAFRQ